MPALAAGHLAWAQGGPIRTPGSPGRFTLDAKMGMVRHVAPPILAAENQTADPGTLVET
jgi:hypothetical protein